MMHKVKKPVTVDVINHYQNIRILGSEVSTLMTVKNRVMQQAELSLILTLGSSLLSLIFNPEDGGNMFL
jgi:hypothetical protein